MATVHIGRLLGQVGFSRTVAIKRMHDHCARDPEFVSMFIDEARLAARIRHPHVVPTLDVVALEGELFLVMEFVQGETLARLIRRSVKARIPISLQVAAAVISGVLEGLHAAHEAIGEHGEFLGIVHRDVSTQNIMVGTDGVSRVLDFGVAKAINRIQTTRDGQIKGKIEYMAPEQIRGEAVDRRTDIYSVGCCLWEMLVGRRLYVADNQVTLWGMVLQGNPPKPSSVNPNVTPELDAITMRGLEADPSKRYETAEQMAIELEQNVGIATPREVGRWVQSLVSKKMQALDEVLAELDSVSKSISVFASDQTSAEHTALSAEQPAVPVPSPVQRHSSPNHPVVVPTPIPDADQPSQPRRPQASAPVINVPRPPIPSVPEPRPPRRSSQPRISRLSPVPPPRQHQNKDNISNKLQPGGSSTDTPPPTAMAPSNSESSKDAAALLPRTPRPSDSYLRAENESPADSAIAAQTAKSPDRTSAISFPLPSAGGGSPMLPTDFSEVAAEASEQHTPPTSEQGASTDPASAEGASSPPSGAEPADTVQAIASDSPGVAPLLDPSPVVSSDLFSGSTQDPFGFTRKKSKAKWWGAGGIGLGLAVIAVLVGTWKGAQTTEPSAPSPDGSVSSSMPRVPDSVQVAEQASPVASASGSETQDAAPATVRLRLELSPRTAKVAVDGVSVSESEIRLPLSDKPVKIVAEAAGFSPMERAFVPSKDGVVVFELKRLPSTVRPTTTVEIKGPVETEL
jgi:serine/threonine-protein kinase